MGLPSCQRQAVRLAPRFQALQKAFEEKQALLRSDVAGIVPENVLVLETIGTVEDFHSALKKIAGLEWMGEFDPVDKIPPDDDFFNLNKKGNRDEKELRGRVYLALFNHRAWHELKSLWERWQKGEEFDHGLGAFQDLFAHLYDIRPWGIQDRFLETGVMDDWQDRLVHEVDSVPCEIELWFRKTPSKRSETARQVKALVQQQGGKVLKQTIIEDIGYHALLIEVPAAAVSQILNHGQNVNLVMCDHIQFFRASGQMAAGMPPGEIFYETPVLPTLPVSKFSPVAAILDGMPLQNHDRLSDRLIIDDPDNFEEAYQASERKHGTAMASLILWGDLLANESPLQRPLYVRPIMQPDIRDWRNSREESIPDHILVVDLIYRAVRRIFEGDGDEPASAPGIILINLSIGMRDRPFEGALSPLARLLDWLSWRYSVLFLVSAGNHANPVKLDMSPSKFRLLPEIEKSKNILAAVAADVRNRRLLSPAEAMNVLTVASVHNDYPKSGS
ncbi:MAG: S8 family peptidase [Magnetococcales bacterium]|nr:S8 family peptidase [Magnetococcales bacterium]